MRGRSVTVAHEDERDQDCDAEVLLLGVYPMARDVSLENPQQENACRTGSSLPTRLFTGFRSSFLALAVPAILCGQEPTRASGPGVYRGYSEQVADDIVRRSIYITVRDGTRLAADIFLPAVEGEPLAGPFPVLWAYDRYQRARERSDGVQTKLEIFPYLAEIVRHGYVVADVDARGAGASFGTQRLPLAPEQARDVYDVTEWLADRPWSTGRVGMWGGSYLGGMQYLGASLRPPSLVAIFPQMAPADAWELFRPGGIFLETFTERWTEGARVIDLTVPAPPVDSDPDGVVRDSALAEHEENVDVARAFRELRFRDSQRDDFRWPYPVLSPLSYRSEVSESGVAAYHLTGWRDIFARDPFLWYWNLEGPQKLIIGPWSHQQSAGLDYAAEHLRRYDYWLKGVENGVMDEAPIHYRTIGDSTGTWKSAREWPPVRIRPDTLWPAPGPSGTVASINDGRLSPRPPEEVGSIRYPVDTTASAGMATRWNNAAGVGGTEFRYADLASNDARGVTWTGAALETPLVITGHPRVRLRVASSTPDADIFVFIEEVRPDGSSHYVTEAQLRLSLRRTSPPPHDRGGLPWRRSYAADGMPLQPGVPVDVELDLFPVSYRFRAGSRIRLTVTGADADSFEVRFTDPVPTLALTRSEGVFLVLPVER